jgi:hypothetical protein
MKGLAATIDQSDAIRFVERGDGAAARGSDVRHGWPFPETTGVLAFRASK